MDTGVAEAATHVYNRTPHKSNDFQVPLKLFAPKKNLHVDKLKRFGCISYVHIPKTDGKTDPRAEKTVLVRYSKTGYVLWHPSSGKFVNSRNVRFNEKIVYKDDFEGQLPNTEKDPENLVNPEIVFTEKPVTMNPVHNTDSELEKLHPVETQKEKPKRGRRRKSENKVQPEASPKKIRK